MYTIERKGGEHKNKNWCTDYSIKDCTTGISEPTHKCTTTLYMHTALQPVWAPTAAELCCAVATASLSTGRCPNCVMLLQQPRWAPTDARTVLSCCSSQPAKWPMPELCYVVATASLGTDRCPNCVIPLLQPACKMAHARTVLCCCNNQSAHRPLPELFHAVATASLGTGRCPNCVMLFL